MQTSEEMDYFNKDAQTSTLGGLLGLRGDVLFIVKNLMS